jgi:alanine racemase
VVKADAYGLGADRVGPALAAAGCRHFFVAHLDEALALRPLLPSDAQVAVLNGLLPGTAAEFRAHGITPVLNSLEQVSAWRSFTAPDSTPLPAPLAAWVHIDTGMNRLGLGPDELDRLAAEPDRLAGITLAGWMTHLARADEADDPTTPAQAARFRAALARLPAAPASLANSSGIFRGADLHFDLVRPGCALYGINPTPETANPMRQAVTLRVRILQVRPVDTGMTVGYGAAHKVARRGKVATVAVGYADGYSRSLSASGHLLVSGVAAPVIGRVSMDLITADVTDVPETALRPGMLADLIGPHRTADDVAREAGTIGYEVLTSLGRRYHRVYLDAGTGTDMGDRWAS